MENLKKTKFGIQVIIIMTFYFDTFFKEKQLYYIFKKSQVFFCYNSEFIIHRIVFGDFFIFRKREKKRVNLLLHNGKKMNFFVFE